MLLQRNMTICFVSNFAVHSLTIFS